MRSALPFLAALLLAGAFLYGRFGDRVRTLLTENDKASLLVCMLGLGLLASPSAQATDWGEYQQVRPIQGVESAGDYQVEIDPGLYSASLSDLADLRIVGPDGREVPFLRRPLPIRRLDRKQTVTAKLLDPVLLVDGQVEGILDL